MAAVASINSLPYEVRQTIYSLVARQTDSHYGRGRLASTIAHYAAVSREWQEEFERFTFRELLVTPKRLKSFSHIVSSPRRRAIVQTICFHVSLDRYEPHLDAEQETSVERRRSTEVLTTALGSFFRAMTHWRKSDTSPLGLDLHLLVDSPNDCSALVGKNGGPLVTARALMSYLKLDLETLSLPYLDVFSGFRCTGRHLQPTSILDIVSRLRALEYLDVELNHDTIRNRDVHQRHHFAVDLERHAETVRVLSLRRPSPMLTPSPAPPKQPWSTFYAQMRLFSQQCESFEFDDCIDAAQFFAPFLVGPGTEKPPISQEAPFWTRLKRLNMRNSYLMKAPYLRVTNRTDALVSVHNVLVAAGRAACRMPELQFARICQYVLTDGQLEWFVLMYERYAGKVTLRMRGFTPGKTLVDAWKRSIADKGIELTIYRETNDPNAPEL
ncbi:hypothetical protein F5Y04DRAFT_217625 [Hypomontagnella monticulosa]|nr:hypothetical protein F5Y04DRAFT_217625 [Hypomontagnella monticulosa]